MLRDESVHIDDAAPTWAPEHRKSALRDRGENDRGERCEVDGEAWREVDRQLRSIAKRRAALDAEEARWLREAEALKIWIPLGMVNALDYLERVLGYGPRAAQDRLRVARALGQLPELTGALARGELAFSAVRELTRVATPATERAWTRAAAGQNLRQIEELVAGHKPGDLPDDPPDPDVRMHVVRWELTPETYAVLRQARSQLDSEHGTNLDDNAFAAALARSALDSWAPSDGDGRARYQIAVILCAQCRQGWQEGAGIKVAIDAAAVERAECDAQYIGSLAADEPERTRQEIPPAVARLVWRRDGRRCRVPGCRSSRGLEIHHIIHRAHGGTHDPSNLIVCCSACHGHHHAGRLRISGTADQLDVNRVAESLVRASESSVHEGSAGERDDAVTAAHGSGSTSASPARGAEPTIGLELDADSRSLSRAREVNRVAKSLVRASESSVRDGSAGEGDDAVAAADGTCSMSATRAHVSANAGAGVYVGAEPNIGFDPDADSTIRSPTPRGSRLEVAILITHARDALVTLGWKRAIARPAVDAAIAALGTSASLEEVIFEALRRCPKPLVRGT